MRGLKSIVSGVILSVSVCGVAIAAPAAAPSASGKPLTATSSVVESDCQKVGGEVSALIDTKKGSPNISAARSAFQVGIMECMEGDDSTANKHYQDAKTLLTVDRQAATAATPAAPGKPAAAPSSVAEADCHKVGGEVSALIDTKAGSPSISAARAAFQVGIMECMEGDDSTANKHYQDAKTLLTADRQAATARP